MSELGVEDIGHSVVGASGAHRWMNCAGSNQLVAKLIEKLGKKAVNSSGFAAAQGTAAHELLARCLNLGQEPWEYAGTTIHVEDWSGFVVDEDMVTAVGVAYEHVNKTIAKHWREAPVVFVERPVQHPDYPDLFGTLDFGLVVREAKKLYIKDYKHGVGVNVEPTGPQMRYYAIVLLADVFRDEFESMLDYEVELTIMQPRQPHHKGPIRTYNTTVRELVEWFHDELLPAYQATLDPTATLRVGDWCGFCPARDHCPALKEGAMTLDTSIEPEELSGDELGALLDKTKAVKKFLENLQETAFKRIRNGENVAGYKLVKKQANRTWKSDAEAAMVKKFGPEAWEPQKVKSPPNIEKLDGGKAFVSKWAYTPDTGYTIAAESDKREAIKPMMDTFLDRIDEPVDV